MGVSDTTSSDDFGFNVYDPRFNDPQAAAEYLEELRWPNGAVCPHCGESERQPYRLNVKGTTRRVWKCRACRKQFTVMVGTIFEDSHVPLQKWMLAFYLLCSSKKGMSAHQLHRMLGVTYKTAWFMAHRIRYAMQQPPFQAALSGVVEVDETYVGGKRRNPNKRQYKPLNPNVPDKRRRKTGRGTDKTPVVLLVERGGMARSYRVATVTGAEIKDVIRKNVDRAAHLRTDSFPSYKGLAQEYASHEVVNHLDEWVRGDVHTNTAENFFSILKRGINGIYHHVSEAHLPRYLDEFDFRYNTRSAMGYTDSDRTQLALSMVAGKRLR
jgi:transposase-like protein